MLHHATKLKPQADHWAVSWTGERLPRSLGKESAVLVQVQEDGNQARIALTPDEAEAMAVKLNEFAQKVRATNQAT